MYQIYVRSFADGNGDGTGDIAGMRSRLPYLERLGIDAIWVNPWYRSPLLDGGYDVADYREIDERFGTTSEAEAFIAEAAIARHTRARRPRPEPHLVGSRVVPGGARRAAGIRRARPLPLPRRTRRRR